MPQHIAHISLLVNDYDDAIEFYTKKLGFTLLEDTKLSDEKRWVIVKPSGGDCSLLLARASNEEQKHFVGMQTGGRVFLFLRTDNFQRDYQKLLDNKIEIIRKPSTESYGQVCVFADLYGNYWDLIEPKPE
jgi:catechol 2,3-dioxygenase-like lactoylglutathione lyase family enzyme